MIKRTSLVGLAIFLAAGLALVGCSSVVDTAATVGSSEEAEAATITLYTSEPQEKIDEIIAAFNEQQPNITVNVFRAGTGDLTARIAAERTGDEIQADVLLAADSATFEAFKADNLLLKYTPVDIESVNPDVIDPDGFYVGTRIIPTVIAYNTNSVDSPPTSWKDLTDTQYAGKIVMPNPDVSGAAAYNAAVWYSDNALGENWLTELAANKPIIADSNGPVAQAVASGTQPIGVVVDFLVRSLRDAGSPIDLIYPSDGVPYVSQPVGIFANTDEPEAAGLFVDFLISSAGQSIAVAQSYLPIRNDVGTPEGAPAIDDINIVTPDLVMIAKNKPIAVALFSKLFG
jgi:iron(III) transport system substrate-binding protein